MTRLPTGGRPSEGRSADQNAQQIGQPRLPALPPRVVPVSSWPAAARRCTAFARAAPRFRWLSCPVLHGHAADAARHDRGGHSLCPAAAWTDRLRLHRCPDRARHQRRADVELRQDRRRGAEVGPGRRARIPPARRQRPRNRRRRGAVIAFGSRQHLDGGADARPHCSGPHRVD